MHLDYTVSAFLEPGNHSIAIYNLLGREVLKISQQWNIGEGSKSLVIPIARFHSLASGIYILTLQIDSRFIGARKFTLLK